MNKQLTELNKNSKKQLNELEEDINKKKWMNSWRI
jgi:hypothetical protein